MSNIHTALIDRYIAIWNQTDAHLRRALIDQTWSNDALYTDPLYSASGHDGINTLVEGFQAGFPGLRFLRVTPVDGHNESVRFSWILGPADGPAIAGGIDVALVADGRLQTVTGFFDFAPAAPQ